MTAFLDPTPSPMPRKSATASVRLRHEAGLHARPAVKLTKLAKKFSAKILVAMLPDGPWIDAKSIVKVIATKTPRNALLYFRAEGEDAEAAILALVSLVEQDFPDVG